MSIGRGRLEGSNISDMLRKMIMDETHAGCGAALEEAGRSLWIQGKPGLQMSSRPVLKKKKNKTNKLHTVETGLSY